VFSAEISHPTLQSATHSSYTEFMDPLAIILTVVAAVLALVLVIVGVQVILVLQEVKRSLQHFNQMTSIIETTVTKTFAPFQQVGGMVHGMKTGFRLLETFSTFISEKQHEKKSDSTKS